MEKNFNQFESRINKLEKRVTKLENSINLPTQERATKKISIREFLTIHDAQNARQKTLAVGYYLEKYESMKSFNVKDLESGFQLAKEPCPSNFNDIVNKNIEYIMPVLEKKDSLSAWVLTDTGESFVDNNFIKIKK